MEKMNLITGDSDIGARIDKFICENTDFTRSRIQKLIEDEEILVNGKKVKSNYNLRKGDNIAINIPELVNLETKPEDIDLDIVYEDESLLVVNKPRGMVVHPAAGNYEGTLVNALLNHCKGSLSGINGVIRPGIVHRIDKDTTGLLLVAKDDKTHLSLAEQIKEHSITRKYLAITIGNFKEPEGTINLPIARSEKDRKKMAISYKNSKEAITHYKVLENLNAYSYIECTLETGRTHQIRLHMANYGKPVLGDLVYGPKKQKFNLKGQMLHAYVIGFIHPKTGQYMEFKQEPPQDFLYVLNDIRNKSNKNI